MRLFEHIGGNVFSIKTDKRELTYRICNYGDLFGFWKSRGKIEENNGVFSIEVLLLSDIDNVCSHLDLRLV